MSLGKNQISDFHKQVMAELKVERGMLDVALRPRPMRGLWDLVSIILIVVSLVFMAQSLNLVYLWMVIGILLYSFNFIINFIPTTAEHSRPAETAEPKHRAARKPWLAIRLLARERYLAMEIMLTVFLGRMMPLAASFSTLFGVGLIAVLYHGLSSGGMDFNLMLLLIWQIMAILLFYLVMMMLQPQTQGITKYIKRWKYRVGEARGAGSTAFAIIIMSIVGTTAFLVLLSVAAILLPGFTLASLLTFYLPESYAVLIILLIIITQLLVMRHLQGYSSRKFAINTLQQRIEKLTAIADTLQEDIDGRARVDMEGFAELRRRFYRIVIYDVIRSDMFSHSPVFAIGIRMEYVLDQHVIKCFQR